MSRTIWVVRHGERVDNVDKAWKKNNPTKWDDPEMTIRGKRQASEIGKFLTTTNIDRIFTSPFTRCLETTIEIVAQLQSKPLICVEPGLMEPLSSCMDPPSIPSIDFLKERTTRMDPEYKPVFDKCPPEVGGDLGCADRVVKTFKEIAKKYPDGNILIVSHGSPIANLHAFLAGHWRYVGQATLSRVSDSFGKFKLEEYNTKKHLSQSDNLHEDERIVPKA